MPTVFQLLLLMEVSTNHDHRSQELQDIVERIDMAATFVKIGGFGRLACPGRPRVQTRKGTVHTNAHFSFGNMPRKMYTISTCTLFFVFV